MTRILIFLVLQTFFVNDSLAQVAQTQAANPNRVYFFTLSYFGEKGFHPGLQLSINRSLKTSSDAEKQKNRFDIGFSSSAYYHNKNHIGLLLTPSCSFIRSNKKGFEYGLKSEGGFMRRFYQGDVFEVDNNGFVKQKYLAGQNAFTYGAYIVLAKNWHTKKSKNIRISFEIGGFNETNYNESSLFHPALNVGISHYFNSKKQ